MVYDKEKCLMVNTQNSQNGMKIMDILEEESNRPVEIMNNLLFQILKDNENTEYGKKYNFSSIKSIKDYQRNVPIVYYEDLLPYIEKMKNGEKDILTVYPFNHFNATSGTSSGACKLIPMTDKQSQIYMKYNNANVYGVLGKDINPKWVKGRALSTSEGSYTTLPSGLTVGSASSKMAEYLKGGKEELNSLLGTMYTTPVEATFTDNGADRIYLQARFAMMDKDMTGIVTGFMSQVVHILSYIEKHYELIINDIRNGNIDPDVVMPNPVKESVLRRLTPMPERAEELEEIFKNGSNFPFVKKVWPDFCYISGAGGASFSVYDKLITEKFIGEHVDRIYSGVTSSEGLWSFAYTKNQTAAMIAPGSAFMEFLPVEAGDDYSQIKTLEELEVGKTYELIVTTVNGFYRYRMSDALTVVGYHNKTPLVEFAYRVNNTISLDGEKTTEKALEIAVKGAMKELELEYFDFCVYPDPLHFNPRYVFLIEPLKDDLEITNEKLTEVITKHLYEANVEYKLVVEMNRIDPPIAYFLQTQTFNLSRDLAIMNGAIASQLKPVKIIKNDQQKNFFMILRK